MIFHSYTHNIFCTKKEYSWPPPEVAKRCSWAMATKIRNSLRPSMNSFHPTKRGTQEQCDNKKTPKNSCLLGRAELTAKIYMIDDEARGSGGGGDSGAAL